jgi:hypothetical protein
LAAALVPSGELLSLGFDSYAAALNASAHNLEWCVAWAHAQEGRGWRWGTCYINELRAEFPFNLGSIPVFATAEPCEYVSTRPIGGRETNIYQCPSGGVDRWGPWFPS